MNSIDRVPLAAVSHVLLLGGTTAFLANLAKALTIRGYSLPVLAYKGPNEHACDFASTNANVHMLRRPRSLIYEDRLNWAYRHLARIQPRAVLANLGSDSFEILRLVPPGVFRIGMVQSFDQAPIGLTKAFARWCDTIVGVSSEICDALRQAPELRTTSVVYIPYGIHFDPGERTELGPESPLRLVYFGRIVEEQKRISRFVELVHRCLAENLPVEFTLAGNGPDEGAVRKQLGGLPGVKWLGLLSSSQITEMLGKQDVVVLLSDYEGLPLSLLEAMAQGVAPLVSDLPSGISAAIPPGCGFRVPVGDVSAALEVVRELVNDRKRVAAVSRAARDHVRSSFGADRMAQSYLELAERGRSVSWPQRVDIPVPLGVRHPWLFKQPFREARRIAKRLRSVFLQEPSSQD